MNNWVTIKTFTLPHEAAVLRSRLEADGIECFIKDEFTVQVYHFYSNAVGGVKLQVREEDVPEAIDILNEGGYITEQDLELNGLLEQPEKNKSKIPVPLQALMFIVAAIIIAAFIYYVMLQPGR